MKSSIMSQRGSDRFDRGDVGSSDFVFQVRVPESWLHKVAEGIGYGLIGAGLIELVRLLV